MVYKSEFSFREGEKLRIRGELQLDVPEAFGGVQYRRGSINVDNGNSLEVNLCHSPATEEFIYTSEQNVSPEYLELLGLTGDLPQGRLVVPGQLILGGERTALVQCGVADLLKSEVMKRLFASKKQTNIITLPVLREGVKYGLTENIQAVYGFYCNEVVSDAHHIEDDSDLVYRRRVTQTIFKDADLTEGGRRSIDTALVADSIASGTVILGVMNNLGKRLKGVKQLELIAPLATLRGLARVAWHLPEDFKVRAHVFETLLNPLPPDYYYSAHFPQPEYHIDHQAHERYSKWWGQDAEGNNIADTACAGYGWSEAFFAPEMQLEMINAELKTRHQISLKEVILRSVG